MHADGRDTTKLGREQPGVVEELLGDISEIDLVLVYVREPLRLVPDNPHNLSTPKIGARK